MEVERNLTEAEETLMTADKLLHVFSQEPSVWGRLAGWWRILYHGGLTAHAEYEVGALADFCGNEADGIEREAGNEQARQFRSWAKHATSQGG